MAESGSKHHLKYLNLLTWLAIVFGLLELVGRLMGEPGIMGIEAAFLIVAMIAFHALGALKSLDSRVRAMEESPRRSD